MKKTLLSIFGAAAGIAGVIVATHQRHDPPPPQPPPAVVVATHTMAVIVEASSGGPVVGADVSTTPSVVYAQTNQDGYTAATVPAGHYRVEAHRDGWHGDPVEADIKANTDVHVTLIRDGPPPCGGLRLEDRRFRCSADGRIWRQRYVTGFPILEQIAHGRASEADAFLDWAAAKRLNGVRVLMMIDITAKLTPDEGAAALPALFDKLKARGMGAELVALADTRSYPALDYGGQVRRVCAAARGADLPVTVETANEPYHPTQADAVQDYANLARWSAGCGVPVAFGAGTEDYGTEPQGDYVTRHLDRGRDLWNRVRRVKDLGDLAGMLRKLVSDDEAIGADESDIGGKRSGQSVEFFAQGALDRFFELGSTFHCTDCISAKVPRPVQDASAAAYADGALLVPEADTFQFVNDSYGVTAGADWSKVIKVYSFIGSPKSYTVLVGLSGDPAVKWANGWHPVGVIAERPGIQVVEIQR